jgi:arabinose-5-phosphate isomerase
MDPLTAAMRDVLAREAEALTRLAGAIDQVWLDVVALFDTVRRKGGRVIVSGVGKSGHVGRKIATSFASTGTPSLFVHGTEASHGDLGMILKGDAVLMLSASGATRELLDVARYCRDRAIPLVLVSKAAASQLGALADHVIALPDMPEAGPNGLAPTTSSTATLAIGDALMVALMTLARFSTAEFGQLHPGGKLGLQTRRALDVMIPLKDCASHPADAPLKALIGDMAAGRAVRLTEGEATIGFFPRDALAALLAAGGQLDQPAARFLPSPFPTIAGETLVAGLTLPYGASVLTGGALVGFLPALARIA